MISISKSAADLLIRRISAIQQSVNSLETEVTDLKTICKQWKPLDATIEKQHKSSETNFETISNQSKTLDNIVEKKECSEIEVLDFTTKSNDFVKKQGENLEPQIDLTTISYDVVVKQGESLKTEKDVKMISNDVVEKPEKSLETEVIDLISDDEVEKRGESLETDVIDLISISDDEFETRGKSLDTRIKLESKLLIPLLEKKSSPSCSGLADYLKQKSFTNVDIIDRSKIRKIEKINPSCFTIDSDGYVWVYTDGSYLMDGRAGIGVWFGPNNPLNLAEPVNRSIKCDSCKTEVLACIQAIKQAHTNNIKKLCINTDCLSVVRLMTEKLDSWKKEFWIITYIELYYASILLEDIKWKHVKGHSGIKGNEAADKLAKKGALGNEITLNNLATKVTLENEITENKLATKVTFENEITENKLTTKVTLREGKTKNKVTEVIKKTTREGLGLKALEGYIQFENNSVDHQKFDATNNAMVGKEGASNLAKQGANMSKESFFNVESEGYVQVFIHGLYEKDGQMDLIGIGVWFGHEHPLNLAEPLKKQFSGGLLINPFGYNGAEVIACVRAIEQAHKSGIKKLSICSATDSTIKSITNTIYTTRKNDRVKNELLKLDVTMNLLKFLKWNKSNSSLGNTQAFKLAKKGALLLKDKNPATNEKISNLAKQDVSTLEEKNITNSEETNLINTEPVHNLDEPRATTPKEIIPRKTLATFPPGWLKLTKKKRKRGKRPKIDPVVLQETMQFVKKRKIDETVVMKRKRRKFYEMQWGCFNRDPDGYIKIFIATACINDGESNLNGIGVWFDHGHPLNLSEPVKRKIKIIPEGYNGAEIVACIRAIEEVHINDLKKLHINTRSEFTIDYVKRFSKAYQDPRWASASELCELHKAMQLLEDIKWTLVKDCSGLDEREGFEAADSLARQGAYWTEI